MEAMLDRLPLPRSRPAWIAAFLLALIFSLTLFPFQGWLARLERNNYLGYNFPIFKGEPNEVENINVSFTLPRYIATDTAYSFTTTIHNQDDAPITVENVFVDVLLPVEKINTDGNLSTTVGPVILSKMIGEQVLPKTILQGQTLAIVSTLSPEEFRSLFDLIDQGIFLNFSVHLNGQYYQLVSQGNEYAAYIINDERRSLINNIVVNILATEKIFWFILGMSMLSCWIVEDKKYQDLWLNDKSGWKAAFATMARGMGVFLGVLLLGGLFVVFSRFAVITLIVFLTAMMFWIFGFPTKTFWKWKKVKQ